MDSQLEQDIDYKRVIPKRYSSMLGDKMKNTYPVVTSCKSIFNQVLSSTNGSGSFNTNYIATPSIEQGISDYMVEEVEYHVTVTYSNTSGGNQYPFPNGTIAVCPYANLACSSITTIIGNSTSTINTSKLIPLLQFNNDEHNLGRDFVGACNTAMFTDLTDLAGSTFKADALVSAFKNYSNQTYGNNGGFSCVEWVPLTSNANLLGYDNTAITNGATGAAAQREIAFIVRNPVWNGLNAILNKDTNTYNGITNFQVSRSVVTNALQRIISLKCPPNLSITNMTLSLGGSTPKLYYNVYNFDLSVPRPLKNYLLAHDYSNLQTQLLSNFAAYETKTTVLSTVNFSNIPSAIYMYCGRNMDSLTFSNLTAGQCTENSDSPGTQITSLQVQFAGQNVIQNLNNAYQVYNELGASEGFMRAYHETGLIIDNTPNNQPQTNGGALVGLYGSVIRIDVSKLNLDWSSVTNGMSKTFPFSATLSVKNLSSQARDIYCYVQPVYDRLYVIQDANVISTYSIVTEGVLSSLKNSQISVSSGNQLIGGRLLAGGAWYNDLWSGVKDSAKWIWNNKDAIADAAKTTAKLVGLGKKKTVKPHRGRGIDDELEDDTDILEYNGGKIITHQQIKNKLKFL